MKWRVGGLLGWGSWRPGRRSMVLLVTVALLGLSGTWLAASALRRGGEGRAAQALREQTSVVSQTVDAEIRRYGNTVRDVAASVGAQADLRASEFRAITAPLDRNRLPGATGVSLVVMAADGQVAAVQRYWRRQGAGGLTLKPATAVGGQHAFTVLSQPLEDSPAALGRDIGASAVAMETLRAAQRPGTMTASRPYRLLRDADLPAERQQLSTLLVAPVVSTSPLAADRGRLRGWIVLGLRGGDFLRESIGVVARDTVVVTLTDNTQEGVPTVLARWNAGRADSDRIDRLGDSRTATVMAGQRNWHLQVTATGGLLPDPPVHVVSAAWIIGGLFTLMLAMLTATVATSRDRAVRRVAQATAALREDIARREAVEAQLRRREDELVGFAGVVAHDLRQPLAQISGYSDFLLEEAAADWSSSHREYLTRLRRSAARMQCLLTDLLDYATADNRDLKIAPVDLMFLAADIVAERTIEHSDPTPVVVVGDLPTVDGDPTLLRQVFDNLIGNALRYTRHGHAAQVEINAEPEGDDWRIEIRDHGIGIPAEQRNSIFTAFARADGSQGYPGTGLGLAIVHRVIERHHGRISADANPGGGTVFTVTLPAEQPRDIAMMVAHPGATSSALPGSFVSPDLPTGSAARS
ncbi:sensor histidine kinase [Actinoplanes couchii]|uniref:Sensor-like histidine kinase SenX3 n=1 Tax=Actinoplanes couchii TaxID=403638 RepID=A0ABQ3XT41_9ACTN|nr:ATP-binding protein [Actinoplanes couchii]MDR6324113.1 signal transduction histidine kinase [Actinoplanes couchii]GID61640.1 hypothetical protein Aco03nite_100440 [Actinoplanes couchii]